MRATRATVEKAARDHWGDDVEAFGHLNTVGTSSGPYKRDGAKEYHAIVRYKKSRTILLNVTKPTAAEAWEHFQKICESPALASAAHWDRLADEADDMDKHERTIGIAPPGLSPKNHQATLFRQTAQSLRLEAATGVPHCKCHLKPATACPSNPRNLASTRRYV